MGGGGSSSYSLKQLLVKGNSNTVQDGEYTITYSADSRFNTGYGPEEIYYEAYNAVGKLNKNTTDGAYCWISSFKNTSSYHWWQVDLGREVNNVCKLSFTVTDALWSTSSNKDHASINSFNVFHADNNKQFGSESYLWGLKYTPEEPKESLLFSNDQEFLKTTFWKPVIINFDPPLTIRYLTLDLYAQEKGQLVSIGNCQLYAQDDNINNSNKILYLKESDNNIYGSLDNEITKITTLDNWNTLSKEEKDKLFKSTNGVLEISQLKSLDKFKVFNRDLEGRVENGNI